MTFRLTTILYVFALLAAALATFGAWGILLAGIAFYAAVLGSRQEQFSWKGFSLGWIEAIGIAASLLFLAALLLPVVQSTRSPSRSSVSMNNMKQLQVALYCYHEVHGQFPPPYTTDDTGRPLHSWRTLLLPYLEEQQLYDRLDLNKPWNSEANLAVFQELAHYIFQSPRINYDFATDDTYQTHYFAVVGDRTAWSAERRVTTATMTEAEQNRVQIIEVGGRDAAWYEPNDLTYVEAMDLLTGDAKDQYEIVHPGYFVSKRLTVDSLRSRLVCLVNGSARSLGYVSSESAEALLSANGNYVESADSYHARSRQVAVSSIYHWDRIWGLALFVLLTIAPWVPRIRRLLFAN